MTLATCELLCKKCSHLLLGILSLVKKARPPQASETEDALSNFVISIDQHFKMHRKIHFWKVVMYSFLYSSENSQQHFVVFIRHTKEPCVTQYSRRKTTQIKYCQSAVKITESRIIPTGKKKEKEKNTV